MKNPKITRPVSKDTGLDRKTIVHNFIAEYKKDSKKILFRYLEDGELEIDSRTREELLNNARLIAASIQKQAKPGDRVILLYPSGLHFVDAFLGCMLAGVISVPIHPPKNKRRLERLRNIIRDSGATLMLANEATHDKCHNWVAEMTEQETSWILTDQIKQFELPELPDCNLEDIVYLQYTSGSTGDPKGVMVSHRNLLHNCSLMQHVMGLSIDSVFVSWLPIYHDLGLISKIVNAINLGATCVLMPPPAFARKPINWLKAISKYRATVSCAPNFAYDLCVDSIPEEMLSELDFTSCEVLLVGAEPIKDATLNAFTEKFRKAGFRPETLMPAWGMAETTLVVTAESKDKSFHSEFLDAFEGKETQPKKRVSSGSPVYGMEVCIVNPETSEVCLDGQEGEIWVRGESITEGYWQNEKATQEVYGNVCLTESGEEEGSFLRTGDMGVFSKGMVFVTGRIKEMMIFRGVNYFPQDVEALVQTVASDLQDNGGAVFSIEHEGEDKLVVTQEIKRTSLSKFNAEDLFRKIKTVIFDELELPVHDIVLLKPASVLKTTSGKIRRTQAKLNYESNEVVGEVTRYFTLEEVGEPDVMDESESSELSDWLIAAISEACRIEPSKVNLNKDLLYHGFDSIKVVSFTHRLSVYLDKELDYEVLLGYTSIMQLMEAMISQSQVQTATASPSRFSGESSYEPFPLNPIQQSYWLGRSGNFVLGNVGCHSYCEYQFAEVLDLKKLNDSWNQLIHRHEMLRTLFDQDGMQYLMSELPVYEIQLQDLSGLNKEQQKYQIEEIRSELSHKVYDGVQWPLFDVKVSKLDIDKYIIHTSFDLLIFDIWSLKNLSSEWQLLYTTPETILPDLGISFREYTLAEQTLTESVEYKRSWQYWSKRIPALSGAPTLPVQIEPSLIPIPKFKRYDFEMACLDWTNFKSLCQENGTTPSMAMCTLFGHVLNQWSRESRFTLNLTTFQREPLHQDVNKLIGDFTSLLLLEMDYSLPLTFKQQARKVQSQFWMDMQHRRVNGVSVLREIGRQSGPQAQMPIVFTSAIGLDHISEGGILEWLGERVYGISQTPQVWLDFQLFEEKGGLRFNWDVVDGLFHEETIETMFGSFCTLLKSLAESASAWQQPLGSALTSAQQLVLKKYNATQDAEGYQLLHEGFLEMVKENPDREAVITAEKRLTYGELGHYVSSLSKILDEKSLVQGSHIGVFMDKGWEQVVAVLAILQSGHAYLPLDIGLPDSRLHYLIKETSSPFILTKSTHASRLTFEEASAHLNVDEMEVEFEGLPSLTLDPNYDPNATAYTIFTSGSTGVPKGVMIDHRGAMNTITDINRRYQITKEDRIFGISALNFDLSVYDIFGPLAIGAALILPEEIERRDPQTWLSWIESEDVTVWNSVPALVTLLAEEAISQAADLSSLRLIMMSGDWIPVSLPSSVRAINPKVELISMGGATEASIWSIYYPIGEVSSNWRSIPYGYPLANQEFHVLDKQLRPCPYYVTGDLYIGGIGLAQGYFNDPEKTAASFITHPETGARLYKTGDLGRFMPEGYIEFEGREDNQVKINGYRVELGEIDSVIGQHGEVGDSLTVPVKKEGLNHYLHSFVVPEAGTENSMSLIATPELITDAVDRISFKLSGEERRPSFSDLNVFSGEATSTIKLNYLPSEIDFTASQSISMAEMSQWLGVLRSHKVEGQQFEKYYYPSAGNCYAVEVYIQVPEGLIPELKGGSYYYDRYEHGLQWVSGEESGNGRLRVHLIGNKSGIKPLYGKLWKLFCGLESGHMLNVLEGSAGALGWKQSELTQAETLTFLPEMDDRHHCTTIEVGQAETSEVVGKTTLSLLGRQSYRQFLGEVPGLEAITSHLAGVFAPNFSSRFNGLTLYAYLKFETGQGGKIYRYDFERRALEEQGEMASLHQFFEGANKSIYRGAQFGYFITGSVGSWDVMLSEDRVTTQEEVLAGALMQELMVQGLTHQLGLCPVGVADVSTLRDRIGLRSEDVILYTCLGGGITSAQMSEWSGDEDQELTTLSTSIKSLASSQLPGYMVPAAITILEEWPLTANGKVDMKALLAYEGPQLEEKTYTAPRTPKEKQLAELFKEVLQVERVGVDEDFFELGGNSLQMIRLSTEIRNTFQVEFSISELFANPSIEQLQKLVTENTKTDLNNQPEIITDESGRYEPFPLNEIQQAYWLGRSNVFDLGNTGCHGYIEIEAFELDIIQLEKSWQKLIERHDMLRTVIRNDGSQQVLESVPIYQMESLNLCSHSEVDRNKRLMAIRSEMSHKLYDAETWPLFDIRVSKTSEDKFLVHLSIDLLIIDTWSFLILTKEWSQLFQNPGKALPETSISFRDYILTQESLKGATSYQESLTYWRNRIDDFPTSIEFPFKQSASSIFKPTFKRFEYELVPEKWTRFKNICQTHGVTPSIALCTLYGDVLSNWSRYKRFAINLTLFNRLPMHEDVNELVGNFATLLLLEMDFSNSKSFSTQVNQTQERFWADMEHRQVNGLTVLREISSERGELTSVPVVFTSAIGLDQIGQGGMMEWLGKRVYGISQTPQVWLDFQLYEENGALRFNWDVVEGLFHPETITTMFESFCRMLELLSDQSNSWDQDDRIHLCKSQLNALKKYNATQDAEGYQLLHEGFLEMVKENPDREAVITAEKRLTYGELGHYVSSLSKILDEKSLVQGSHIGVFMDKGWEQVVAVLAILQSGHAYLPLDIGLPDSRLHYLIKETSSPFILTKSTHASRLTFEEASAHLNVDEMEVEFEGLPSLTLDPNYDPNATAYTIFTSGSTGVPKGVMIDHRGAMNTITDINRRYQITKEDRIFGISALNFDLSVYDIFGPLAIGAALILPEEIERRDPQTWLSWIESEDVTVWNSVPALVTLLAEEAISQAADLSSLRLIMMSGDWIPVSLPSSVRAINPKVELISMGGATEASIWSIYYPIGEVSSNWRSIPYGYPLANQEFHVLDKQLRPCPYYVTGDLYIGGIGLAQGYFNDPEKTAASFITHPETGARLYKTGDLGRFMPEGYIEFEGREDNQVKINGYRVELGEIDSVIGQHGEVGDSLTVPVKKEGLNHYLHSFVVPEAGTENSMSLIATPELITDAVDRISFKLSGEERRPSFSDLNVFSGEATSTIKLNYLPSEIDFTASQSISMAEMSQWLGVLRSHKVEGQQFEKYYYPSAGNCYAVEVYIQVPEGLIPELKGGSYYYDRYEHGLQWVSGEESGNGRLRVHLIGNKSGIKPLYGKLWKLFCGLESGHMLNVLEGSAGALGWKQSELTQAETLTFLPEMDDRHHCTTIEVGQAETSEVVGKTTLSLLGRQSYRQFLGEVPGLEAITSHLAGVFAPNFSSRFNGLTLYAYLKFETGQGGKIYRYDFERRALEEQGEMASLHQFFEGANKSIYRGAQFGYFITGSVGSWDVMLSEDRVTTQEEVLAGALMQELMVQGLTHQLGLCPVGVADVSTLRDRIGLRSEDVILYTCLGGGITSAQMSEWSGDEDQELTTLSTSIKSLASSQLPGYMVPAAITILEEWPLTANGKVDMKALLAYEGPQLEEKTYTAPRTPKEKQLAELFKEVLQVERVGVDEDFFELGGNSLQMIRLSTEIRKNFEVEIPLEDLFRSANVAYLSKYLVVHSQDTEMLAYDEYEI